MLLMDGICLYRSMEKGNLSLPLNSVSVLYSHTLVTEAGRHARDRALQWGAATLQNLELHCVSLPPPSGLLWYRSWCWAQKKRVFTVQSLESSWFTITCHSRSLDCRRMEVLLLKFLLQDIGNDLGLYLSFILLNKIPCLRSECKPYSLITADRVPAPGWFRSDSLLFHLSLRWVTDHLSLR